MPIFKKWYLVRDKDGKTSRVLLVERKIKRLKVRAVSVLSSSAISSKVYYCIYK